MRSALLLLKVSNVARLTVFLFALQYLLAQLEARGFDQALTAANVLVD